MSQVKKIGPHAESGFTPTDVLRAAEQGDSIRLELDLYGPFITVSGRVDNIHDESDPQQTVLRTIYVDVERSDDEVDLLEIELVYDPDSSYAIATDVHVLDTGDEWSEYEIDDLAMCELERDSDA